MVSCVKVSSIFWINKCWIIPHQSLNARACISYYILLFNLFLLAVLVQGSDMSLPFLPLQKASSATERLMIMPAGQMDCLAPTWMSAAPGIFPGLMQVRSFPYRHSFKPILFFLPNLSKDKIGLSVSGCSQFSVTWKEGVILVWYILDLCLAEEDENERTDFLKVVFSLDIFWSHLVLLLG